MLFTMLSPIIARMKGIHLEVFGSGGYASVRDLRHALRPLHEGVRFWGEQSDVGKVYPMLDYVLSGLPEKEALGLNLIEAQAAGTPVLAIDAPPFTETVLNGVTGHLYRDPREDGGAAFEALLASITRGQAPLSPEGREGHLDKFSRTAFRDRVSRAMTALTAPYRD
jgi:glycosyltransferase involved in cell wall biosynthesis